MSERLPLYAEPPHAFIEHVYPIDLNPGCNLCPLGGRKLKTVCMAPHQYGEPGGLLVVGEAPGRHEDARGEPFVGPPGILLRSAVARYWLNGNVTFDNAVKCAAGADLTEKDVVQCRGYLAKTIREVRPRRIVALGAHAAFALLGRSVSPFITRRAYSWLIGNPEDPYDMAPGGPVPIFMVFHPAVALRNAFVRGWFDADMAWALTTPDPQQPPLGSLARVVTSDSAEAADRALRAGAWFAFDVETAGRMHDGDFRLLSLAACARGSEDSWVWDRAAIAHPQLRGMLRRLLADPEVKKVGQNVKYDCRAVRLALGTEVRGICADTRLMRKLMDPEAAADLETMAELVGMGGHKAEAQEATKAAVKAFRTADQKAVFENLDPALESAMRLGGAAALSSSYTYALLPRDVLLRYNARDAVSTARLTALLEERLALEPELSRVWEKLVLPASQAIEQVEHWGIAASASSIESIQHYLGAQIEKLKGDFAQYGDFNPNSVPQVANLLFCQLKLPVHKTSDSGKPSTDREALEALRHEHPIVASLLSWRSLTKLKGTYADGLIEHVRSDGRIHPSYHIDGTRSGRMSCIAKGTLVEVMRDVSMQPKGVPIEDVRVGDLVYCFDSQGRLCLRRVTASGKTGEREVVRLRWRGQGRKHRGHLDLTPEHRVRRVGGEYAAASSLVSGDRVMALSRGNKLGYSILYATGHPEIRDHRFVYREVFGEEVEHVHHRNGNKLDNRSWNLQGMTAVEHLSHHGQQCSDELREFRAKKMKAQWQRGEMKIPSGEHHSCWLGLAREDVQKVLVRNRWSVTRACRELGHDFNSFKGQLRHLGFDLELLKRLARDARREEIKASIAHAREARFNHEVLRVERLPGVVDVYDLTVEDAHNFIVGEICVHNCSQPNLQNVPRSDTPEGRMIRDCFIAPQGRTLLEVDYCLAEGTLVDTPAGAKPIESLREGQLVFTYNRATGRPDCSKICRVKFTGVRRTIVVTLDNGERVRCTPEHRWLLANGSEVFARDLAPGMRLLPLRRGEAGPNRYRTLYSRSNRDYVYEHKAVAAAKVGIEVGALRNIIHHLDENPLNNAPENLAFVTRAEHARFHAGNTAAQWRGPAVREAMSRGISAALADRGGHAGERNPNYGNRKGVPCQCAACNRAFYQAPSRRARYCSAACYNAKRRGEADLNHRVVDVENDGLSVPTYDVEVVRDHNFALSAGVFVHNSQIELRVAAMLSGDPLMREIYVNGEDYHMRTARMVSQQAWGIAPDQVEKQHRTAAKTVNFAVLYGASDAKIAAMIGCTEHEAMRLKSAIFGKFTVLARWVREKLHEAQRSGECWTFWEGERARRRPLWRIADQDGVSRSIAEHGAVNSPVQGTANDYCLASLTALVELLRDPVEGLDAKLVLTVHDSLLFEVADAQLDELAEHVRRVMLGWPTMNEVPLEVDMKAGKSWGSLESYPAQKNE